MAFGKSDSYLLSCDSWKYIHWIGDASVYVALHNRQSALLVSWKNCVFFVFDEVFLSN